MSPTKQQYLDKIMISFTAVLGIYEDTGITQNQFGWIGSILFIGQIVFQVSILNSNVLCFCNTYTTRSLTAI